MTVILVRHGRSTANTSGVLAGRSPGIDLDDLGRDQAESLVGRLAGLDVAEIVRSPLLRCERTVAPLAEKLGLTPVVDEGLAEVDYGRWTGRPIKDLLAEPLWKVVQQHPSAAVFPDGEGLAQVQARAVAAIRRHDTRLAAEHDRDVVWIACSHGDVIKSVLADALGNHLDGFQRIVVEPASVSVVRYTPTRPFVLRMNDTGADLSGLNASAAASPAGVGASDAVPGGAAGTSGKGG
ncbi:histidine phosphatase family protein [Rhodococcus sp. NPDC058532]|uniref:histidine phosphatase family protein n=1 Tax=Rhodococcus sp. NPDC058532 TaxID=3346540 RepID=UPI00365D29BC